MWIEVPKENAVPNLREARDNVPGLDGEFERIE
jgi:hypothetical protein